MLRPVATVLVAFVTVGLLAPDAAADDFVTSWSTTRSVGVTASQKSQPTGPKSTSMAASDGPRQTPSEATRQQRPSSSAPPKIPSGDTVLQPAEPNSRPLPASNPGNLMFDPQCYNSLQELAGCRWQPPTPTDSTPSPNTPPAAPTRDQIEAVVRSLASRLDLPEPTPLVGPDPSVNEWNRSFVGLPIWLWTAGEPTLHSTVTGYGITITMMRFPPECGGIHNED